MEDESAPITVKIEIEEDQTLVSDQIDINEEHNYNKIMEDDLYYQLQVHHSIDIKEESEEVGTENSCFDEISIQRAKFSSEQQIKKEDPNTELSELQQSVDIKVEDDFMEVDNHMRKEINIQGEGATVKYLTLEDFGAVKTQKLPVTSDGKFLKQLIEIGKQRNIASQILNYYTEDVSMNKQ